MVDNEGFQVEKKESNRFFLFSPAIEKKKSSHHQFPTFQIFKRRAIGD
jgi:hypothetical protein